jgi:hypothetical protein
MYRWHIWLLYSRMKGQYVIVVMATAVYCMTQFLCATILAVVRYETGLYGYYNLFYCSGTGHDSFHKLHLYRRYLEYKFLLSASIRQLLTYLLTELSPSWEAANCAAIQEIPSNFKESEYSSPCSQEPSTAPYPEPVQSNPYSHFTDCSTLIVIYHPGMVQ